MFLAAASSLAMGGVCGTRLRFLPFLLTLVVAMAGLATMLAARGFPISYVVLNCAVFCMLFQVGYGVGLCARALARHARQVPRALPELRNGRALT